MALRVRTSKATVAIWSTFAQFFQKNVVDPFKNYLHNRHQAAAQALPGIMADVASELKPALDAAEAAITTTGKALRDGLEATFGQMAKAQFDAASATLSTGGESTPNTAIAEAAKAFAQSYAFGMSSGAVTALFEMLVPEKLNVLNGTGAMLAEMAGFKEVTAKVLEPLYENAFGQALKYYYQSQFKPEFADEADAVQWHSRRLMSDADLREVFHWSGLKAKYEEAYVASAYRSVQPRAIVNLIQDVDFPETEMTDLMQFAGLRDQDIALMLPLMKLNSTKNVRFGYLTALKRSVELGTDTMAHLDAAMNTMRFSDDAKFWVQEEVNERKIQQLAELYRKSVSDSYKFGTLTDQQYVPALEAIGIAQADAEAHYAIDSIIKHGKIAAAAVRAAERLAAAQQRAAMQAALAEYAIGAIDAVVLEGALLAAGVDPTIAGYAVNLAIARRTGTQVLVYGVELPRHEALLLREKVAALKEQALKKLSQAPAWLATLASLGIPDANARALVSEWEAQANKLVLPI